jgi:adenosylhomocysteine nucleosidase
MKNMKKIVVTFALPQEQVVLKAGAYEFIPVVTGVGKARSALVTMKAVMTHRPELVLNVGTAGTLRHLVGDILVCRHFFDRDFSKTQLPGISYDCRAEGAVPFRLPSVVGGVETWEGDYIVNTGDDFVTAAADAYGDVFDMEAFAQQQVCQEEHVPFVSVKYVTDIIGQNSVKVWADKLADARSALTGYFKRYLN